MRFYLIDDSPAVTNILSIIIQDRGLGQVCGTAKSPPDALEDLPLARPDIVIVDLLMPEMDGVAFVERARQILPEAAYIMLSQVTSKDMVAAAYRAGVEFFLHKPVNSIEVENVVRNVSQALTLRRTFSQLHTIIGAIPEYASRAPAAERAAENRAAIRRRAEDILRSIGILGEAGSRDILEIVCYLANHPEDGELSVSALCAKAGDAPKTVEQRIRRAVQAGLVNLAHLGLEDYSGEVFTRYAGTLYRFDQVRREMNCAAGRSSVHGKVQLKPFLSALVSYAAEERW